MYVCVCPQRLLVTIPFQTSPPPIHLARGAYLRKHREVSAGSCFAGREGGEGRDGKDHTERMHKSKRLFSKNTSDSGMENDTTYLIAAKPT